MFINTELKKKELSGVEGFVPRSFTELLFHSAFLEGLSNQRHLKKWNTSAKGLDRGAGKLAVVTWFSG